MTTMGKAHLFTCVKALLFTQSTSPVKAHLFTVVKALLFTLSHISGINNNNEGSNIERNTCEITNNDTLQIEAVQRFQVSSRA